MTSTNQDNRHVATLAPAIALALCLTGLLATPAQAGDASIQAEISEAWQYNTNPLMAIDQGESIYGSVTHGTATLRSSTPTTALTADVGVTQNIFNDSHFSTTDLHGGLNLTKQIERWSAGIQGAVDYDATRSSELTAYGTNVGNVRHLGLTATPRLGFQLSPIDLLSLTGTATLSRYDNTAYADYYILSIAPGYTHNFTPRDAATLAVQYQRYQATQTPNLTVETISPTIGWTKIFSPQLTGGVTVGTQVSQQHSDTVARTPWEWQYVFAANLAYQNETDHVTLRATREQYPFGNGTQSLLTTFSATATHAINASFTLGLAGSYQDATYQERPTGTALETLLSGSPSLIYHITDRFDLSANYIYRRETLLNSAKTVQDHATMLRVTYHPPSWKM